MKSTMTTLDPLHAKRTAHFTRHSWFIPVLIALGYSQCYGGTDKDDTCLVKPGGTTILVPLQNAPKSFEPQCQPARIRVTDRTKAKIRLTGLSPLDVCTLSSKPQTVTTVVNPLEAIINAVTGLKAFGIGALPQPAPAAAQVATAPAGETGEMRPTAQAEAPETSQDAFKRLRPMLQSLSEKVQTEASQVFLKQQEWLVKYQKDVENIAKYVAQDYRGIAYSNFHPRDDDKLDDVRRHVTLPDTKGPNPLPTETDYAHLQALVDQMSDLQKVLTETCSSLAKGRCEPSNLDAIETPLDSAKAFLAVAQDNLKTLQTAQAAVVTAYTALVKVYDDYVLRKETLHIVDLDPPTASLYQDIYLGPDYGATDTGSISCVNDAAPTQATTDAIAVSLLYQNVPRVTVSAGLLTTFQPKRIIGVQEVAGSSNAPTNYFKVTDSSRAQVFPMAFVNLRTPGYALTTWPGQPENELVIANSVSAGIGINPNTGTNQAEFFVGDAVSFGRVYIHAGAHIGRTESLGGGFQLNTPTNGVTSAPINWNYHVAFSIGLSVRLSPF